jgi:hypothetical protein
MSGSSGETGRVAADVTSRGIVNGIAVGRSETIDHGFDCEVVCARAITRHIASARGRRLIAPLTATITEYGTTKRPNVFRMP